MAEKLESFVILTRDVLTDFYDKKISLDELTIYTILRLSATPYGISTTSLENIQNDIYNGKKNKSTNYINKKLLSLKKLRRIFYKNRRGSRGTFQVHCDNFIHPKTKKIISLDKLFELEAVEIQNQGKKDTYTEPYVSQNLNDDGQNSNSVFDDIKSLTNAFSVNPQVRTHNNDKDNNKDNNTNNNRGNRVSFKESIFTDSFKSKSYEEDRCLFIAQRVGEPKMNFILSILHRYGIDVIEKGFTDFESEVTEGIKDRPAFFNSKIQLALLHLFPEKQEESLLI